MDKPLLVITLRLGQILTDVWLTSRQDRTLAGYFLGSLAAGWLWCGGRFGDSLLGYADGCGPIIGLAMALFAI